MKRNQYRSPFPLFSSIEGGGNLSHYRYVLLFLDANKFIICPGPDSVMVRASRKREVAGSNPGRVIPKTLKMVPVATLLGAQHS